MAALIEQMEYDKIPNKKAKSDVILCGHCLLKREKHSNSLIEGIVLCRHCDASVKYSGCTTNLNKHVNRHRPVLKTKVKVVPTVLKFSLFFSFFSLKSSDFIFYMCCYFLYVLLK